MKRFLRFLRDDDGMEFLQVAIVVAVVAFIAIAVWALAGRISNTIEGVNIEGVTQPGFGG